MIKKYKKGDEVIVRVGKDKGKIGKISKIINSADKVVISGVNVSKKHQKPSQESKGVLLIKKCQFIFQIFWLMTRNLKNLLK